MSTSTDNDLTENNEVGKETVQTGFSGINMDQDMSNTSHNTTTNNESTNVNNQTRDVSTLTDFDMINNDGGLASSLTLARQALTEEFNDVATVADVGVTVIETSTSVAVDDTDLDVSSSDGLMLGNHHCGVHHSCCCCKIKVSEDLTLRIMVYLQMIILMLLIWSPC